MNKILASIVFLTCTLSGYSQDDGKGTIDPQRPTLTESYSIVGLNILQFENGLDYFMDSETVSYGSFIRGSVTKRIELRVFTDYNQLNSAGAKFLIMDPKGTAMEIGASFVYNRDLANNSDDFRLALTRDFNTFFVTCNFGYNDAVYGIALLGVPLSNKASYFAEFYDDPITNRIHTGFTWIPQRDIQLDISGGWMSRDGIYVGLGASFRLR